MKSKFILATLVIIALYIFFEFIYATMILGMPLELAMKYQLQLRGIVIASLMTVGLIANRYFLAQQTKYNLYEQFEHLQEAVIGAVFSPAPLHVKAQNLLKNTLESLPLSYMCLVHYRKDSIEIIDQQGDDSLRLGNIISLDNTTLHPIETLLLDFYKKKIPKHEAFFNDQILLFISLKPTHLNNPVGAMIALFKPGIDPKNIHHDALDFLAQNSGFLLSLWAKKVQTLQSLSDASSKKSSQDSPLSLGVEPYSKLQEVLLHEYKRHKRYGTGLTLLLLGVDFYENLCNIFGKDKGEIIIKNLSNLIKSNIRTTDIFGHWDKEIFGIVLADNTFRHATSMAHKLQRVINKHHFGHPVGKITCSFGISTLIEGDSIETLRNRAKQALEKARSEGGDGVEISLASPQNLAN